ncbi:MAG: NAD(P)H-hydrate dehydratase, partial [Phycisphaerales bacterium]|nr:NAD(P)H-hydrate dehydratase [Phycisphaerales bacterium]
IPSATAHALPVDDGGMLIGHACAEVLDASFLRASCIAIGPGLGYASGQDALVLRTILQEESPVVLDADAITVLANMEDGATDFRARGVITPHPGEYRRLAETLAIDADPVEDKAHAASRLAQRLGVVAVVKGAGTAVSDGIRTWTCTRGSNVLATGGTGDVLTGCIAGLIAQFDPKMDLFDLACLAVEAHARASERWTPKAGMLADELADHLPEAIDELRAG